MTEHFTREESVALAIAAKMPDGFLAELRLSIGINAWFKGALELAVTAKPPTSWAAMLGWMRQRKLLKTQAIHFPHRKYVSKI